MNVIVSQMNRRDFMLAVSSAVAASSIPEIPEIHRLTLYGDNIHDDYDALKSLFLGKSVNVTSGMYELSIKENGDIFIRNGNFNCGGKAFDIFSWPTNRNITVENCCFGVVIDARSMGEHYKCACGSRD